MLVAIMCLTVIVLPLEDQGCVKPLWTRCNHFFHAKPQTHLTGVLFNIHSICVGPYQGQGQ